MSDVPLRVAQVVCTDAFAGVERYVTTLACGLSGRGCDVVVIGGAADQVGPAVRAAGARWLPGSALTRAGVQLSRHRPFDLVHAHMTAAETAALASWAFHRAPVVATRHFAQTRGSSFPARALGRLITPRLSAQLAISRFVADSVEGPTAIVPPGTAVCEALPDPAGREKTVLVAQRLEAEKRTDLALAAWAASGLAAAGWRLVIAGDGAERSWLEERSHQLGVTASVDFLGHRTDVGELQRRAGMFLATRPDEPFGLSVVEAMAVGLPVVAADGGGHCETAGRAERPALYPPFDADAAGAMLADLALDDERRFAYGRELAEIQRREFTAERQTGLTLDLYRTVLA